MVVQAMKSGALEILSKPFAEDELLSAIHQGIARSQATLLRQRELRGLRQRLATLTRREQEIMRLVVADRLNKQIAAELHISEITVKADLVNMAIATHRHLGPMEARPTWCWDGF
jgi:FixJ family two-component response regulator